MELYGSLYNISGSVTASAFSGSFIGDGSGLTGIQASGVTGLNLSQIASGDATASISTTGFTVNKNTQIQGNLSVSGALIANEYIVSSSVTYMTTSFASGSSAFGDDLIDTHTFSGSVNIRGSISLNGSAVGTGKLDETTFQAYTSSNDGRVSALETSSGSLNSFTSSIDTTIKSKLDAEDVISGSVQVEITGTTGYSTFSSSISNSINTLSSSVATTTSGLTSTITSLSSSLTSSVGSLSSSIATTDLNQENRLTALETSSGSLNSFTSSINTTIKSKLDSESVISGSAQVNITGTTGYSTFSSSVSNSINTLSGSVATTTSGLTATITSLSSSLTSSIGILSSSVDSLSSSVATTTVNLKNRVDAVETSTGSLNSFTSSINTTIKSKLDAENVISGSIQVNITGTTGYSSFSSSVSSSIGALSSSVATTTSGLGSTISNLSSSVATTTSGLTSTITSLSSSVATTTSGISSTVTNLSSSVATTTSGITSTVTSLSSSVATTTNNLSSSIGSLSSSVATTTSGISSTITNLSSSVATTTSGLTSTITSLSSSLTSSIGSLSSSVATTTSGLSGTITSLSSSVATTTSGISTTVTNLSSSIATTDLNQGNRITSIEGKTGSYATTGSNVFQGSQTITGSLYISQDLIVAGSSSIQHISSSIVNIADNIITVNAQNPAIRFGGLAVIDSGSSPQVSGSILFDATENEWIVVHQNQTAVTSALVIMGPETYNDIGNEIHLTNNRLVKSVTDEHIGDSNISDNGTTVTILSNTVINGTISSTGTTIVSGSSQIAHDSTTGYAANKHIDHTAVSITAGNGLSGGGDISATRTLSLDTTSATFTSGVKTKMNTDGVISGSSQVLSGTGIWSGSAQLPSGVVSGSSQVLSGTGIWSGSAQLPSGVVSGSSQVLAGTTIHSGAFFNGISVVSGSGQISFGGITGVPSGLVSGSGQISFGGITGVPSGLVSGSSQITFGSISSIPSGLVSGSSQITLTSTQVTNGLGYTPYNATNPNGYITGISFANVSGKPTTISGYGITDAITTGNIGSQTVASAGNSTTVGGITPIQFFNNMGDSHGTRTSFDASTPSYNFGFRYVQGSTNGPGTGASQYYSWYIGLGNDYPATGGGSYGAMFAVDRNSTTPYLSVRYNENNNFSSWRKIYAGYADTAGTLSSMNISQFTNNSGYITGINSSAVTTALGYTPYNATNPSGYISSYTETSTLANVTSRGSSTTTQISINLQTTINTTTPGLGTGYGLHFGGQTTNDSAAGITFSAGGATATNANAGIYVQGSGSYGTKMYIATTDSYATGSKTAISIDHTGLVNIVRGALQQGGNQVLHAGNFTSYAMQGGGYSANQNLNTSNSPTFTNLYNNAWFRNNNTNEGIYNQANGTHFYSNSGSGWAITGSGGTVELQFRSNHQSTLRGYVYGDTSSNFGLLDNSGNWQVRCNPSNAGGQLYNGWTISGNFIPTANNSYNLGSASLGWANVYTNDLHLSNMNKPEGNDIDGTNGTWTIQEGAENLYIINNNNGKKYKIDLTEII